MELSANRTQCGVHLVHTRAVLNIQYPIDLRQMPAETPRQFGFPDTVVSHAPVENHLHGSERRQANSNITVGGRRNVLTGVDPRGNRLFERVDSVREGIVPIIAEGGKLREVR